MFKTERIEELVKYVMCTGYLHDEDGRSLSCMLIASPEEAKTSIINQVECKDTLSTMDLSPKPIRDTILPKLERKEIHHLIIPDLLKVLAHKSETCNSVILFLNALMEEGVKTGLFFGQTFDLPCRVHCGLLTSITPAYFYKVFRRWYDIGFTSRFIPISYEYSELTTKEIHSQITNGLTSYNKIAIDYSMEAKKNIAIPQEAADWISLHAQDLAKKESAFSYSYVSHGTTKRLQIDVKGFRLHKQLRQLARAIAMVDGKEEVKSSHLVKLNELIEYINFPDTRKEI